MNSETSSYCYDLQDFDFDFELAPKTSSELAFLEEAPTLEQPLRKPKFLKRPSMSGCSLDLSSLAFEDSDVQAPSLSKKLF